MSKNELTPPRDLLPMDNSNTITWQQDFYDIADPYVNKDGRKEEADAYIGMLTAKALDYYGVSSPYELISRKRKSTIDRDNPATKQMCDDIDRFGDWLDIVPTALALENLTNPDDPPSDGIPKTDPMKFITYNCEDAIGLRSRIEIASRVMQGEIIRVANEDRDPNVLSLASGVSRAVIELAARNRRENGIDTSLSLVDIDPRPLDMARQLAKVNNQNLKIFRRNIVDLDGFMKFHWLSKAALAMAGSDLIHGHLPNVKTMKPESYDVVDILGFFEYLQNVETWPFSYNGVFGNRKQMIQAGAPLFMAMAWDMVAPGGVLLFGNMNKSDPHANDPNIPRNQLGFAMGVIQWPHIQPRNQGEIGSIVSNAVSLGLMDPKTIEVPTAHIPRDGIYNDYTLRKIM